MTGRDIADPHSDDCLYLSENIHSAHRLIRQIPTLIVQCKERQARQENVRQRGGRGGELNIRSDHPLREVKSVFYAGWAVSSKHKEL